MDYNRLFYQFISFIMYCAQQQYIRQPVYTNETISSIVPDTSNRLQNNYCKQVENLLDETVAQSCVSIVEKHMGSVDELKNGRASFESKVLNTYEWEYSSSYLVAKTDVLERDVRTLAKAKNWTKEFSEKVINLAQLTVKDEYMKITFATETTSKVELSIIAAFKDDIDNKHYIKVMKVENSFTLAPDMKNYILEQRDPIYVKLRSASGFLGWYSENEQMFHSGDKVQQRIEQVVESQKVFAGEFANMHKYFVFKVCRNTVRPFLDSLNVEASTKSMMEWNDSD